MNKFQYVGTLKYNKVFNTHGHAYLTRRLYYQRIIHKYECLSSLFFSFFLLEIEREREYVIAKLRKGVGRNSCKVYLAFWRVPSESIISFYGQAGFYIYSLAWRHQFFLSKILFCFFTRSLGHSIHTSCHPACCPKTDFLILISADEKGCYFRFRILANHLASFFCQAIRLDYYLFHPVTECKHLLAFILTWICYFGREELTYIPISLFNGQSLAAS